MLQLLSKKDYSSLCYDVIITHQKFKIDKFVDFSSDSDFNSKTDVVFRGIPLLLIDVAPRAQRSPLADTKCPQAAQCKQGKRGCL